MREKCFTQTAVDWEKTKRVRDRNAFDSQMGKSCFSLDHLGAELPSEMQCVTKLGLSQRATAKTV